MPILFQINSSVNRGSTGRIAEAIGQLAMQQGWQSYIAYGRHKCYSQSVAIRIGTNLDVLLHGLKTRLFDRHGFGSVRATQKLVRRIKEIRPDIIHLHNVHGNYINIEILFNYLAIANIPVIWTLHDCWPFTGHCAHFDLIGCNRWITGCYSCPQKKMYPSSLFLENSKANYLEKSKLFNSVNSLTMVPVSKWLGDILNRSFMNKYPFIINNNGVDLSVFTPKGDKSTIKRKLGVNKKFMIVGVAAIWSSYKGLNDFIDLSKMLDSNYCIVLIGVSNKQIKELPSNIVGLARTEDVNQLADIYSAADLFINPTYQDNFPTTNIESLACGTPILTYQTGGSGEAVSSDTGFIVEKGDLNGIINVINIVKENGKLSYLKACRERAVELYNKDDRFYDYIKLYDQLLINRTYIS